MTGETNDELGEELRLIVMRLARRIRLERSDDDLSDGQLSVLAALVKHGAQTLSQLSEHERVTPPSMNRTVNALVDAALCFRSDAPDDGRKVLIEATDAGATIVRETKRQREAWFARQLGSLPAPSRATLETAAPILRELADS